MALSDTLGAERLASQYFLTRLGAVRQAQHLQASEQFDLARSPLSDDELEDIVDQFRDTPSQRSGWGLSEGLEAVLSREPKSIPISDLKALQNNLIAQGYAPPDAQATGIWDTSWYASFRRFDRDNFEAQRQGRHWYSAPLTSGINALTNTLPSRVFQGIVGGAVGVVTQTPETFERLGAVGGAGAGAAIGAAVGSVVPGPGTAFGAVAGGIIGGAAGFLSDLFGDEEAEPDDQSSLANFVDALSPWTEYNQNPKDVFKDLGYVLTATSYIAGVGLGAKGAAAGVRALQAARTTVPGIATEAGALAPGIAPGITPAAAPSVIPGVTPGFAAQTMPLAKAALMRPPGANQLGVFGTVVKAATRKLAPGSVGALEQTMLRYSGFTFGQRYGPNIALKAFGGASQAAMGARIFGGLGQGSRERTEEAKAALEAELGRGLTLEEVRDLERKTAQTAIERAVTSAPELKSGVELPLIGDMVDLAAFVLYPEKLLPFRGASVARSSVKLMGDTTLAPFAHALQHQNPGLGIRKAVSQVKGYLTPLDNAWMRADYGIDREAHLIVSRAFRGNVEKAFRSNALPNARADIVRTIRQEFDRNGKSDLLEKMMRYSMDTVDGLDGPTDFTAWLTRLNGKHRGLDRLASWKEANKLARRVEREVNEARPSESLSRFRAGRSAREAPGTNIDRMVLKDRIALLENRAKLYERRADRGALDPFTSIQLREQARLSRAEGVTLQKQLDSIRAATVDKPAGKVVITPARVDFADQSVLFAKREEFLALRQDVLNAVESANRTAEPIARQKLANFVDGLAQDGHIPDELALKAKIAKPSDRIAKYLETSAKSAAKPLELPEHYLKRFDDLGYKPVATGDDVLFPDQLEQMTEIAGIGDYTRRAQVWETIGLSPAWRSDRSLFRLRREHELAELNDVFARTGVKMSGEQAMRRLYERLRQINHDGAVLGPFVRSEGKTRLYKVDARDLSPDDIFRAFEDVPGVTDEVAHEIFGALRRGAAYGGEAKLMAPVQTMKAIGNAMRLNGLPGFADVIRTAHTDVPSVIKRSALRRGEYHYKPLANADANLDLAHSVERARVEAGLKEVAHKSNVSEGQRQMGMQLLDSLITGQVKAGRFASVDDAYRHLGVEYADRYLGESVDALFKKIANPPTVKELKKLARNWEGSKTWYEDSARTLSTEFGMLGKVRMRDGSEQDALDVITQLVAVTSPRKDPKQNFQLALDIFQSHVRGEPLRGVVPSVRGMVDDVLNGRHIRTWDEPVRTATRKLANDRQFGGKGRFEATLPTWHLRTEGLLDRSLGAVQVRSRVAGGATAQRSVEELRALKLSIGSEGIQEPLLVEVINGKLAVVDGTHRAMLAEELGLKEIPVSFATTGLKKADETYRWLAENAPEALREVVPSSSRSRMKVWNFYHNLSGEYDKVTVDTWMARLFGFADNFTPQEYDEMAGLVKQVSDDLGWFPAQTQAALWAAVKDQAATDLAREIRALEKSGLTADANKLRRQVSQLRDASSYADAAGIPKIRTSIDGMNGLALMQKVQDDVLGLTQFGPDFDTTMRFFRTADFSTLIHEDAHLLRRLLPEEDLAVLERTYGVTRKVEAPLVPAAPAPVLGTRTKKFRASTDEMHAMLKEPDGGFTWDPHTGEFVPFAGGGERTAVAIPPPSGEQTLLKINPGDTAYTDPVAFRREIAKVARENDIAPSNVHIGGWHEPETGTWHIDLSEVAPTRAEGIRLGQIRRQKAVTDLGAGETINLETLPYEHGGWSREAEERFAREAEAYVLRKVDPGHSRGALTALRESMGSLWGSSRGYVQESNAVPRDVRRLLDKTFEDVLSPLPGSRTKGAAKALGSKQAIGGAVLGGVAGAATGEDTGDILKGVALGAAGGLATRSALRRTYGYLPDYLTRLNTALRYTLSFTFDAGRFTEQNMIAMAKHDLPPMLSPTKYIKARDWKTPFGGAKVSGDDAWNHAVRFWDELNGTSWFVNIDDLDRRLFQSGMLGFSPRNWEIAQAFQLYQRGMSSEKIREAISQIGRYGLGRNAAEKSANFIVFPFSFSKKLITTMGDFFLQAPARNLILHESYRRYHESEFDDKVSDFLDRHVPLLKQLMQINNLAFGISPGRFFLQGLSDQRTDVGKAMQIMASVFVPSGAATSLAQTAGGLGDLAVHAFSPVVLTGESITRGGGMDPITEIFRRYVPFVREMDQYFLADDAAVREQLTALKEGAAPYYQFQKYQDELKEAKSNYEALAPVLGYSSLDGLLQSDVGMGIEAELEVKRNELADKYPTGFKMSQTFENSDAIDERALLDISEKAAEGRASRAEEQILELKELEASFEALKATIDPAMVDAMVAKTIREKAVAFASDRTFAELYDRFFLYTYGPIRRVA